MRIRAPRLMAVAIAILTVQAIASYGVRRDPFLPSPPPLAAFPLTMGDWTQVRDGVLEPEVLQILGPDDALTREYQFRNGETAMANVFIAYYKTQLRAKNAHDPKVCLPGAGWNPTESRVIEIPAAGSVRAFPSNYYRIARDSNQSVVLYWFQSYNGVYTFEQQLRAHRLIDSVMDNRTDMALVRIVIPIGEAGVHAADARATELAQLLYPQMLSYFPSKEKSGS